MSTDLRLSKHILPSTPVSILTPKAHGQAIVSWCYPIDAYGIMVLDVTPDEANSLTSLPTYISASEQRRISTLNDSTAHRLLNAKKSQRKLQVRPSHPALQQQYRLDNETAQPNMKRSSVQPSVQAKKSTSSLFNLFSKPKVEKARGYGGESSGTTVAPAAVDKSKPLTTPYSQPQHQPSQRTLPVIPRQQQALPAPPSQRASIQHPKPVEAKPLPKPDKNALWEPPPLFQAFARSVKHGLCETSVSAADKNAARLRAAAREKELEEMQAGNRNSLDSELSEAIQKTKMTVHTARGVSNTHVELPQKIVVLLDDGHILQYSQHGPTNRVPEKVLALGPDSAAFINDATPFSPGALRVVQNTGNKSFSFQNTVQALSRFTRRTTNTKRDVPILLLAFRTAQDINEWQHAIREYIDSLKRPLSNSSKAASEKEQVDSVVDDTPETAHSNSAVPDVSPPLELRTPAKSSQTGHTSQVDQNGQSDHHISHVGQIGQNDHHISHIGQTGQKDQNTRTGQHDQNVRHGQHDRYARPAQTAPTASHEEDADDPQRKGSLEMVEEEAEKLLISPQQRLSMMSVNKRISDASSFVSSGTPSMDAQALNNLRNSMRMSHMSSMTTATSRTSSMISEPSSNKPSQEHTPPYRSMSSYQSAKRRSVLPTANIAPPTQPVMEVTSPDVTTASGISMLAESPLLGTIPLASQPSRSPALRSPHLVNGLSNDQPDKTPTIAEEDEGPESIVADLPPPSTWTKLSPKKRSSFHAPPQADRPQQYRYSSAPIVPSQQVAAAANRRASHGFRIPLKINPNVSTSAERSSSRTRNRTSLSPADPPSEKPKVFTLEAKVDPKTHRMSVGQQNYSSSELRNRASQRLSLFPSPLLSQTPIPERTRSHQSLSSARLASDAVPTRHASLQRPTSLQVASSVRNSMTNSATAVDSALPSPNSHTTKRSSMSPTAVPIRAAPIRQLKPSRSASAISSMVPNRDYERPASPTDPFTSGSPPMGDTDLQIPARRQSAIRSYHAGNMVAPVMPMGNSFAQQRVMQQASYQPRQSILAPLPGLEAFGPPAPPPNAPLPATPNGAPPGILSNGTVPARSAARLSAQISAQLPAQTGLGIRV